jgi:hypothetical protein
VCGMPAIDDDYRQSLGGECIGYERSGYSRTDDGDIAAAVAGQRRRNVAQPVAEQPERVG